MIHGTYTGYNNHGCRCEPCIQARRDYRREHRTSQFGMPRDTSRRHCLICGTALSVHPMRACWRELR